MKKCNSKQHWENIIIYGTCYTCGLGAKDYNEEEEIEYVPVGDEGDVMPEIIVNK